MLKLTPEDVFPTLNEHMLVDGYSEIVVDLQKSEGNYIYDSLGGRKYLDMFSYFATAPIGHNHPAMHDPEFKVESLFKMNNLRAFLLFDALLKIPTDFPIKGSFQGILYSQSAAAD